MRQSIFLISINLFQMSNLLSEVNKDTRGWSKPRKNRTWFSTMWPHVESKRR